MTRAVVRRAAAGPWRGASLLCLAAIALGVFADQGQRLPGPWAVVPQLGTPWALLGFAGGRLWLDRRLVHGSGEPITRTLAWAFAVAVPTAEMWRAAQYGQDRQGLQALLAGSALCLLVWAGRRNAAWWPVMMGTLIWGGVGVAALVVVRAFPI